MLLSFSLWSDPWIDVLHIDGGLQRVSLADCLTDAHHLRAILGTSPLTSAAVHRLVIAIAQDIFAPSSLDELAALIAARQFDPARVAAFGAEYSKRFVLFNDDAPFLQRPGDPEDIKKKDRKPAAALFPEVPSGTRRAWFQRIYQDDYVVCPACAASGIVSYCSFATGFGPGIRATITGEGTLYIFPEGQTLFESLARSLLTPDYLPPLAALERAASAPWRWEPDVIGESARRHVGYLESLVFPARVIRLLAEERDISCDRCGQASPIAVPQVLLEKGWYYGVAQTKGAAAPRGGAERLPTWIDPFVAYRTAKSSGATVPVRASSVLAPWREYATLIGANALGSQRPLILDQLAALAGRGAVPTDALLRVRCVGLDVIKQADYRGWLDEVLDVPIPLLRDAEAAGAVALGLERAQMAMRNLGGVLSSGESIIGQPIAQATVRSAWANLAAPFRALVVGVADPQRRDAEVEAWSRTVLAVIEREVVTVLAQAGQMSTALRERATVQDGLSRLVRGNRKKWGL